MNIKLTNVGKRFNTDWIFTKLNYEFRPAGRYAITGPNGSGKSTLLQIIGGFLQHNAGVVTYSRHNKEIASEKVYQYTSIAAPYLELIEEMTLAEFFEFHARMKGLIPGVTQAMIAEKISMEHALNKQIRYYSSGMKQRVKLAQAFFGKSDLVLLDEPLSNLDANGHRTYHQLVTEYGGARTIIVSSNDEREYHFCDKVIHLDEYK